HRRLPSQIDEGQANPRDEQRPEGRRIRQRSNINFEPRPGVENLRDRARAVTILMSEVGPLGGGHPGGISTDLECAVLASFLECVVELGEDVSFGPGRHAGTLAPESPSGDGSGAVRGRLPSFRRSQSYF